MRKWGGSVLDENSGSVLSDSQQIRDSKRQCPPETELSQEAVRVLGQGPQETKAAKELQAASAAPAAAAMRSIAEAAVGG